MIVAKARNRRGTVAVCVCLGGLVAAAMSTVSAARAQSDDRAAAETLISPLEHASPAPVTAEAVARAREALEQATRFRAAGDEAHAKAADGLAREWAETARDLSLATAAEAQAEDRKRQAIQAQAKLERTRALVEDGIARLGRVRAELGATQPKAVTAVEVHDGEPKPSTSAKGRASAGGPSVPSGASPNGSTP